MNFRDEKRKKTEEIEQILKAYLPVQEGKQQVIMEAMEYLSLIHIFTASTT